MANGGATGSPRRGTNASGNILQGNYIGVNPAGTAAAAPPNGNVGVEISNGANSNLVGADGSSALSKEGERIHGNFFGQSSFATHALCHERNVVKVPDDAPLELLGPLASFESDFYRSEAWSTTRPKVGSSVQFFTRAETKS